MTSTDTYAISTYFTVEVDGSALGPWATLQGFGMKIASESRETGGVGNSMTQLPGRFSYTNIQLGRPVCSYTTSVVNWLTTFSVLPIPATAEIKSLDSTGKTIASWSLYGVIPAGWTGPSFDIGGAEVATETLELAYEGFLA
ncbi:MAG TPA: phage tail protein [Acidimicrobiales bacterium]|jgi:phage tail-like protein